MLLPIGQPYHMSFGTTIQTMLCHGYQMHDDDSDETAILKLAGKKLDQDECERLT